MLLTGVAELLTITFGLKSNPLAGLTNEMMTLWIPGANNPLLFPHASINNWLLFRFEIYHYYKASGYLEGERGMTLEYETFYEDQNHFSIH